MVQSRGPVQYHWCEGGGGGALFFSLLFFFFAPRFREHFGVESRGYDRSESKPCFLLAVVFVWYRIELNHPGLSSSTPSRDETCTCMERCEPDWHSFFPCMTS